MPVTQRVRWRMAARTVRGKYSRVAAKPNPSALNGTRCRNPALEHVNADLVVLGQTRRIEHHSLSLFRQSLQDMPCNSRPHAAGRDERTAELPRSHVYALTLREVIAVAPVCEFAGWSGQRQHRNLHHGIASAFYADHGKRFGMNHVLGVMQQHRVEVKRVLLFVGAHAAIDPVQAIGFRGRPRMRTHRRMYVAERSFQLPDRRTRGAVIWIGSDEEFVIVITDGADVVPHHIRDHGRLVPARHENRDAAFTH